MLNTQNYSANFQAQLQHTPRTTPPPVKKQEKIIIRYKRSWTKEPQH